MRPARLVRAGPIRRPVAVVVVTAMITLALVGVMAALAAWMLARAQTRDEAADSATRISDFIVGPLLLRSLAGDVQAGDELRRAVENRTREGSVLQITAWTSDGTVVFSSDPRLIGRRIGDNDGLAHAEQGSSYAEIAATDDFGTLPPDRQVVEVYVPMRAVPGLVLETYEDGAAARDRATALVIPILGICLAPLVLLQALQSPVLLSLVRRVRDGAEERSALLEQALSASERERREIAAGLHDTVVQDLAGVGYVLAALRPEVPDPRQPVLDEAVDVLSASTDALRRLMLDLHPPELTWRTLPEALERLAGPVRESGAEVSVRLDADVEPDRAATIAVFRIVRECLVNVVKHARARHVSVAVVSDVGGVRLTVADDGVGIAAGALDHPLPGHLGTALIRACTADLGGTVRLAPGLDGGTTVEVDLPAPVAGRLGVVT